MILTCPSCMTRFRVAGNAFGEAPRAVRCKNCQHVWKASYGDLEAEPGAAQKAPQPAPKPATAPKPAPAPKPAAKPAAQPAPKPAAPAREPSILDDSDDLPLSDEPGQGAKAGRAPFPAETPPIPPEEDFMPVPRLRGKPVQPQRSSAWNYLFLLLILVGIGAGAGYYFRVPLVLAAPQLNQVFAMIGAPIDIYAETVKFDPPSAQRAPDGGLIIAGSFVNTSGQPVDAGALFFTLNDGEGKTVQYALVDSPVPTILPGERVEYTHTVGVPDRRASSLGAKMIPKSEADILRPAIKEDGLSPARDESGNHSPSAEGHSPAAEGHAAAPAAQ